MPRKPRPDQPVMASASRLIFGWGGFAFGTITLQQHLDLSCDMGLSQRTPKPPSSHAGGLWCGGRASVRLECDKYATAPYRKTGGFALPGNRLSWAQLFKD